MPGDTAETREDERMAEIVDEVMSTVSQRQDD